MKESQVRQTERNSKTISELFQTMLA
uniref:Uncharacterized protein n=1 Tax=Anguilla anguilla TaxID=7936 RepID=A0A0E9TBG9_ANGAN